MTRRAAKNRPYHFLGWFMKEHKNMTKLWPPSAKRNLFSMQNPQNPTKFRREIPQILWISMDFRDFSKEFLWIFACQL